MQPPLGLDEFTLNIISSLMCEMCTHVHTCMHHPCMHLHISPSCPHMNLPVHNDDLKSETQDVSVQDTMM